MTLQTSCSWHRFTGREGLENRGRRGPTVGEHIPSQRHAGGFRDLQDRPMRPNQIRVGLVWPICPVLVVHAMTNPTLDIAFIEQRNRVTTAVRMLLALPDLFLSIGWGSIINLTSLVQWSTIVITGKRNKALFDFMNRYLAFVTRTYAYAGLMFDTHPGPAFAPERPDAPLKYLALYSVRTNRLTSIFRVVWAIPALLTAIVLGITATVTTIVSWFSILVTGKMSRQQFDYLVRFHRYAAQTNAYLRLMTDEYPKYSVRR
jgi:hypothetical protein